MPGAVTQLLTSAPTTVPWRRDALGAAAAAVFIQGPTSAELYKYLPNHNPPVASILAVAATFLGALVLLRAVEHSEAWRRLVGSRSLTAILLAGITVASPPAYYLWAHHLPRGTPGSAVTRAMAEPVHALLAGRQMYHITLPPQTQASPGPLWIILNAPFTLIHASWLLIPFWLAVTAVVVRVAYGRGVEVNVALVIGCVSPHFLRMIAEDQDLLVVPCAMLVAIVGTSRWMRSTRWAVGMGVFAGVLATSRFIYLLFPLVLGLLAWRRSPRQAIVVTGVGIALAGVANLVASIGVHPYPPVHLFGRASFKQPTVNIAVGVVVTAVIVVGMLIRYAGHHDDRWLCWLAGAWALSHGLIGFGELAGLNYNWVLWEGANYLFVGGVALLFGVMYWRARPAPEAQYQPNDVS